jgi:hypothetical protein
MVAVHVIEDRAVSGLVEKVLADPGTLVDLGPRPAGSLEDTHAPGRATSRENGLVITALPGPGPAPGGGSSSI